MCLNIRKSIFFTLLILAGLILPRLNHFQLIVSGNRMAPFGTYGLAFSTMKPKTQPRVIILGNSVLRLSSIVKHLEQMRQQAGLDVELGVFAMPAASVADYIIMHQYVRQFDPDLILIQTMPLTFGYFDEIYRTDAPNLLYTAWMKDIRTPLMRSTLSRDQRVKSFFHSHVPLLRTLPLARVYADLWIDQRVSTDGLKPMRFFGRTLNQAVDIFEEHGFKVPPRKQFVMAPELLRYLIERVRTSEIPTVFVEQESGFESLPANDWLPELVAGIEHVRYYNFKQHYNPARFADEIHPHGEEEPAMARRLFEVIRANLGPEGDSPLLGTGQPRQKGEQPLLGTGLLQIQGEASP